MALLAAGRQLACECHRASHLLSLIVLRHSASALREFRYTFNQREIVHACLLLYGNIVIRLHGQFGRTQSFSTAGFAYVTTGSGKQSEVPNYLRDVRVRFIVSSPRFMSRIWFVLPVSRCNEAATMKYYRVSTHIYVYHTQCDGIETDTNTC